MLCVVVCRVVSSCAAILQQVRKVLVSVRYLARFPVWFLVLPVPVPVPVVPVPVLRPGLRCWLSGLVWGRG